MPEVTFETITISATITISQHHSNYHSSKSPPSMVTTSSGGRNPSKCISMGEKSVISRPLAHLLPLCPSADQAFLFLSSSRSPGADQAFFPSLCHVQILFPKVPTRLPPPQLHRQSYSDLLVTGEQQLLQTAVNSCTSPSLEFFFFSLVQPVFTMASTGGSGLQIVSEKLSETNYASWAVAVELYVEGHDKLDILHGTKVKPDEKDPSFRTWRRDNIQLMTWMLNSVNSSIKQVILHNKTAYDMWKTLEQMYGRRHDMLRTYQISSRIFKLEQGSMSVTNYFATLKGLWDEFDYYRMENWSSTDDHQRYLKLLEKDRIIKFLDGLTAEFESLKGQILGLDPTPLEQVYYKILSEEGRKRTMNNKGISTGGIRGLGLSVTGPSSYSPWVIDSGATDHMTNAANSFISYPLSSGQEKVIIADGTKATVAGKGSIKLTDHFFLSSALHDLETKQTIGTGREVGGLYYYQLETTSALKSAAKLVPQVVSSPIPLDVIENRKDALSPGKDAPSLGAQSSPDIITYKRRRHKQEPPMDRLVESDALAPDPVKQLSSSVEPTTPLNMNELGLPVAVRKGVRSCTQHPISNHVSYSRLSPSYHAFVSQLSNHAIPSSYYKVRKYVLDLLKETGKLGSRPASTPIEVNHDLTSSSGEDLTSLEKGTYQRLVGKLLYLSMTRPDITYAVSVVSQYMHAPKTIHMKVVDRILRIIERPPLSSIDEVFAKVKREESRRSVMVEKRSVSESIENSALFTDATYKAANYQRRSDDKPRVWSKEGIFVNQRKYILDLLGETGLLGCKMVEIEPNLKLQAGRVEEMKDKDLY
ncbi:hypothetical protein ZIOFF_024994 [Zingiber officinale]|uniref:Retrovirus-related Pol polyprotein from transposon TNT 1-94-like beta-barrel domain-containing protein n=1 Tax=Zingiber officinale TaxID=94328 RepID=A0A8J5H140_ZINOF|nr:hypothetical protein ZIOFF_024994 [Zingiber officinale]